MKFTGNPNIDKHIKRGLGPMDKVNMDDYWSPHIPFLEYVTEIGSEDDIKIMLEDNFGIDNLLAFGDGNDERVHVILAKQGYAHDKLASSDNPVVRAAVAESTNNPEQFLGDDSSTVKVALIHRNVGLDLYANDKSIAVQQEVIKQGYNLDQFVKSESPIIRRAVAQQGYGLEELSLDDDVRVLEAVARTGYDAERFANHENQRVQYAACVAGACPEKFARHDDPKFRAAVAENGQCLNILQHDDSRSVLHEVIKHHYNLERFVNHPDDFVRESLVLRVFVSQNDELKNKIYPLMKDDSVPHIRNMIANDGYFLDQYVKDDESYVREAVAHNGYGLDILVHDTDEHVLMRVAEQGYGLELLKDHPSSLVRGMVAAQGYQPEVFVNDPSEDVAAVARPILAEQEWERVHEVTLTPEDLSFVDDLALEQ